MYSVTGIIPPEGMKNALDMLVQFDQRSQAADFPLFVPQGLIPVGLGLTALLTAVRLFRELAGRDATPAPHDSNHAA